MTRDDRHLGRGVAFPPRLDETGRWASYTGAENIRESVRIILMTELGERVMLPSFGAGLAELLHEPNTVATHRLIQDRVRRALVRLERRINVETVDVEAAGPADPRAAVVTIRYALVASGAKAQVGLTVQLGG